MLISIINIFFIMTTNENFNNKLKYLLDLITIKGNKYEYTLNNSLFSCKVFKTITKQTIEMPIYNLMNYDEPKEQLNHYFAEYMKSLLLNHYEVFTPIINSINFKLVIEINHNKDIINIYYKTAFFTKSKNTVVRIDPFNIEMPSHQKNKLLSNINHSKHIVVKNLFGLTFDNDFIFDKDGITLIEMLSFQ